MKTKLIWLDDEEVYPTGKWSFFIESNPPGIHIEVYIPSQSETVFVHEDHLEIQYPQKELPMNKQVWLCYHPKSDSICVHTFANKESVISYARDHVKYANEQVSLYEQGVIPDTEYIMDSMENYIPIKVDVKIP